jgi:hypothetical protein
MVGSRIIISSASNGRWSWGEQAYNILSHYQAILDITTYLSLNKRSMRAFDMDLFRLHTGALWPRCVLSMAIS